MRGPPGGERVVEHHPRAPERPGQRDLLARRRVQAVGVTKLHAIIIVGFMAYDMDIRTGRHCVFVLHAHLVFVTKYRHAVFTGRHLVRLEEIMRDVCTDFETELQEFNGESSHVHLLVNFPPKVALSKLVNSLKGVSSRQMRQEFPDLRHHYWRANRLWSGSYFAGSVGGAPISVLRQYIEQQNRPA
jgi:putative transposase